MRKCITAAGAGQEQADGSAILTRLSDVQARHVSWLWPGRIPLGRISLLVGRPGEGKSFLTTDIAARVTRGRRWPDGGICPRGSVLLIAAEDDPGDTIRPRCDAHGADAAKIHVLSGVQRTGEGGENKEVAFTLSHLRAMEGAMQSLPDLRLIVIDPIGSYLGGKADAHRDNEVRSILAPVAKLAERCGAAVLIVAHRRKSGGGTADETALGSRAFTGIARAVWHLSRDPERKERRLLLPGKNNLAREGTGLAFTISGEPAAIVWEDGAVEMSADDGWAAEQASGADKPGPKPRMRTDARLWLMDRLANGAAMVRDVKVDAKQAGFGWRTVQRASVELGVLAKNAGAGSPYTWQLQPAFSQSKTRLANLAPKASNKWHPGNLARRENPDKEHQDAHGGSQNDGMTVCGGPGESDAA